MLTSFQEHARLIEAGASDWVQPDAPRVGGVTPFLQAAQAAGCRTADGGQMVEAVQDLMADFMLGTQPA